MLKRLTMAILNLFFFGVSAFGAGGDVGQRVWSKYFPNIEPHNSEYEPEFGRVSMDYVTPHTKWANPSVFGRVKALVLAPRVCHRDTVELAQRLDMTFDAFGSFGNAKLSGATGPRFDGTPVCAFAGYGQQDQVDRLKDLLRNDYDTLIIGGMSWDAFPSGIQETILEKVSKGTGLVISFTGTGRAKYVPPAIQNAPVVDQSCVSWISSGMPFTSLYGHQGLKSDEAAAREVVGARQFGRGRVVILSIGGASENTYFVPPMPMKPVLRIWQVDYYFSMAAKAVLWACGKGLERGGGWSVKDRKILFDGGDDQSHAVQCVRVRNDFGEIVWEKEMPVKEAALPALPPGNYMADVILKKDGKSFDWGACAFEVKGERKITSVSASPAVVKTGDRIFLTTTLDGNAGQGLILNVKMWDMDERLIAETIQKVPGGKGLVQTEIIAKNPLSSMVRCRVFLKDAAEREMSHWETFIPIKLPYDVKDVAFLTMEDGFNEYPWHYARRSMKALGVDLAYTKSYQDNQEAMDAPWMLNWVNALAGMRPLPWIASYRVRTVQDNAAPRGHYERRPCLSDPKYMADEKEGIRQLTLKTMAFGPPAYCLGDENYLSLNDVEVCFSDHCKREFRKYLEKQYGGLCALNEEWGSSCKAWEEVEPLTLDECRASNQPARWVDFRLFMEEVFLRVHINASDTAKECAPGTRVGFDGMFNTTSYTGYNWWKLGQHLDFLGIYPDHLQAEILRSFQQDGTIAGRWYGGYRNLTSFEEYAHWEPWYTLFHGMNTIWWYNMIERASNSMFCSDTMNPTSFEPFPILKATSAEVLELKRGIGKLLLNVRRDDGGIAILYSQSSLHAATFHEKHGNPCDSQLDFIRILEDLYCQYRFISCEQLAQGMLTHGGFKLVILPCCVALSKGERDALLAFTKAGGRVIADATPGIFDEHGRAFAADGQWSQWLEKEIVVIGNKLRGYKRGTSGDSGQRRWFLERLKENKIKPEYPVNTDKGDLYEGELSVFVDGKVRYLGLLRNHSPAVKDQRFEVAFPSKMHVYNVRTGRYLGHQDRVGDELKPGMAGLWALFPTKPAEGLSLTVKPNAKTGGGIEYCVGMNASETHVVRITVKNPKGIEQRHHDRNLLLKNDSVSGVIPVALNDERGEWTILAVDAATGRLLEKLVMVE